MGAQAMLNVRMDKGLKAEGDSVLAHAGTSATEAIRSLYRFMEEHQEVPTCCLANADATSRDARRTMMRELIGIAPLRPGEDADSIKEERLSRLTFRECS